MGLCNVGSQWTDMTGYDQRNMATSGDEDSSDGKPKAINISQPHPLEQTHFVTHAHRHMAATRAWTELKATQTLLLSFSAITDGIDV